MNSNKSNLNRNSNRNDSNLQDKCRELMNYHVVFTMRDGSMLDGIIEGVDDDNVTMLIGEDMVEGEGEGNQRQFGPRRFRRYRRRRIPFSRLVGLSLLAYPFIFPPFIF